MTWVLMNLSSFSLTIPNKRSVSLLTCIKMSKSFTEMKLKQRKWKNQMPIKFAGDLVDPFRMVSAASVCFQFTPDQTAIQFKWKCLLLANNTYHSI